MEYALSKTQPAPFAWRFPLGFQIIFLLFLLAAAPFYPESPRHLAKIGDLDGARQVLTRCRLSATSESVNDELGEIQNAIRLEETSASHSYYSMLFSKDALHTRRRIMLGCGVQVMQKLTGIDFIATYAPEMFALAGFGGDMPALLAGGNLVSYTVSLAVAIYLCDHVGRRRLMWIGCTLMGIVLIVGGVLSHEVLQTKAHDPAQAKRYGAGVTAVLYIYTFTYGSTLLTTWYVPSLSFPLPISLSAPFLLSPHSHIPSPLPSPSPPTNHTLTNPKSSWVYPTEIFPLASRAKGAALATVAFSLAGGVINEIVPYLISAVGFWVFILFALINLFLIIPIWLFYPETANIHLEDLDLLFASRSPFVWRAKREFLEMKDERRRASVVGDGAVGRGDAEKGPAVPTAGSDDLSDE